MNRQKGFAPIISLLVIVGVIAVSGGIYYYQLEVSQNKESIISPAETSVQETKSAEEPESQESADATEDSSAVKKEDMQEVTTTKTPEEKIDQKQLQQKLPPPQQSPPAPAVVTPHAVQRPPSQISCVEDTWECGDWSACTLGAQFRSCKKTFDCPGVDTLIPWENRACIKENKSQAGEHRTAVIMVNFLDKQDKPLDSKTVEELVFSGSFSLNAYIKEVSYNKAFLTGSIFGWYTILKNISDYCPETRNIGGNLLGHACERLKIAKKAISLADPEIDFRKVDNIIVLVAGTTGIDQALDGGLISSAEGLISAPVAVVTPAGNIGTLTHEFGHSLGLQHASGWRCGTNLVARQLNMFTLENDGCKVDVGQDMYDPMGSSRTRHYSAYFKEVIGFLSKEQIVSVNQSGEYLLDQFELPSPGIKALKIPLDGFHYYLEYRKPLGFDGLHSSEQLYIAGDDPIDGVLIRLQLPGYYFGTSTLRPIEPTPLVIDKGSPFVDVYRNIRVEVTEKLGNQVKVKITK